jgi:hypothetical protein
VFVASSSHRQNSLYLCAAAAVTVARPINSGASQTANVLESERRAVRVFKEL